MTEQEAVSQERANLDLNAIAELRLVPAFTSYFIRRLKEKQAKLHTQIITDECCSKDEREIARKLYLEYEGLINLLNSDEAALQNCVRLHQKKYETQVLR